MNFKKENNKKLLGNKGKERRYVGIKINFKSTEKSLHILMKKYYFINYIKGNRKNVI